MFPEFAIVDFLSFLKDPAPSCSESLIWQWQPTLSSTTLLSDETIYSNGEIRSSHFFRLISSVQRHDILRNSSHQITLSTTTGWSRVQKNLFALFLHLQEVRWHSVDRDACLPLRSRIMHMIRWNLLNTLRLLQLVYLADSYGSEPLRYIYIMMLDLTFFKTSASP